MDRERRQALGEFLRNRRAQLTPTEVGLPSGIRRRTPGLRREEVAQLANIGVSWYIWLEQGRDVQPSAQVLESLSLALRLTTNERRHLFLLANQPLPPVYPLMEKVDPAVERVLYDLMPSPAFVLGRRWDFLAWNEAADAVFEIARSSPPHPRNLIWSLFTNPMSRTVFFNWEQIASAVIAEFRAARARYVGNPSFETLLEDLKRTSPEFRRLWSRYEAPSSLSGKKRMEHPVFGHLEFEHMTLQIPDDPDIRVMVYIPDPATRISLGKHFDTSRFPLIGEPANAFAATFADDTADRKEEYG